VLKAAYKIALKMVMYKAFDAYLNINGVVSVLDCVLFVSDIVAVVVANTFMTGTHTLLIHLKCYFLAIRKQY